MNLTKKTAGVIRTPEQNIIARLLIALCFVPVLVYFFPHAHVSHYKYEQGRPWNYAKLIAPFDLPIHPDSATVSVALDSLNRVFVPVYKPAHVNIDSITALAMARMNTLRDEPATPGITAAPDRRQAFYRDMNSTLRGAYGRGVLADSVPAAYAENDTRHIRLLKDNVLRTVARSNYTTLGAVNNAIDSLAAIYNCTRILQNAGLSTMLAPSLVCDEDESARILASEKALITIDRGVIQRGQTIIDKGAVISEQDFTNLRTYEHMLSSQLNETKRNDFLMACGQALFIMLLFVTFSAYLYFYERSIWDSNRKYLFFLIIISLAFLLARLLDSIFPGGIYLTPMAIIPVLTLVFFNARTALWTASIATLLCSAVTTFPMEFIFMQFTAAAATVFALRDLTQRSQLFRASLFVGIAYLASYLAIQLMVNGSFDDFSWRIVVMLCANALLTSMAYVLMFVVERTFGFVSNVTLVELADTNNPILRELSDECPGTFQHSVAVSTLAGDAARQIGANVLLVRAGAMYHDIGKMDNPAFFTENQRGVNPHDGLTPLRSAQIITSHVPDGLRRAVRAGIPEVVRDFISQHHGKGTAKYFYITACREAGDKYVDPAPYSYPGPNPRTREASVLMMADAVEAASRSLREHTPQAITDLVNRIIDTQIAEGLHNDSPLSFKDVGAIKAAFTKRLITLYHSRITYPDAPAAGNAPAGNK